MQCTLDALLVCLQDPGNCGCTKQDNGLPKCIACNDE